MKLVVGNQKCYMDNAKLQEFKSGISELESNNFILCPSNVFFHEFKDAKVTLGGQNISICDGGAATGEISCEQLKSIGISYCIVGHSERREMFNESIEDTNIKVKKLLEKEITPILCTGETLEEKNLGKTKDILLDELTGAFDDMDSDSIDKIIVAYEPIWSIGTGLIPSNDDIVEIVTYIKDFVKEKYNSDIKLLYGGSVNLKNIDELNKIDVVDGYLIGGASTKINEITEIINKCK